MIGPASESDILYAENDILIEMTCTMDYDTGVRKKIDKTQNGA